MEIRTSHHKAIRVTVRSTSDIWDCTRHTMPPKWGTNLASRTVFCELQQSCCAVTSDCAQYEWIWDCTRHTMPPKRGTNLARHTVFCELQQSCCARMSLLKSYIHIARNSPTHLSFASSDTTYKNVCCVIKPALNFSPLFRSRNTTIWKNISWWCENGQWWSNNRWY